MSLIEKTSKGLYCSIGDFFIDPTKKVDKALITHAHSDHARKGHNQYICQQNSKPLLQSRLGKNNYHGMDYGESIGINGVKCSFHPAGHVIGSAQIRVEYKGEVWVISGDYKLDNDGVCTPFEVVKCHTFITESTFGMPIYQWEDQSIVYKRINNWWKQNASLGIPSVLYAYSLGKAQRILKHLNKSIGKIFAHQSITAINRVLNDAGLYKEEALDIDDLEQDFSRALLITPSRTLQSSWGKHFTEASVAAASGWLATSVGRSRMICDTGFVLSDHADWYGLVDTVLATEADTVYVTHGYESILSQYLASEHGLDAHPLEHEIQESRDE